jgi:hypothetical protein
MILTAIAIAILVWLVLGGIIGMLVGPMLKDAANNNQTTISDETYEVVAELASPYRATSFRWAGPITNSYFIGEPQRHQQVLTPKFR